MALQYLTYQNIDKEKWDHCVHNASNRLIYAQSFYLDAMADNWHGIVMDDYKAVMPLTWRNKWGINYLYQPAFTQQGGIYTASELPEALIAAFLTLAFQHFKFAEFTLNYANNLNSANDWKLSLRNNFVLPLNKPYETIRQTYSDGINKNIKRASKQQPLFTSSDNYREVLELYKTLYHSRLPFFSDTDFANFSRICEKFSSTGDLIIRQVVTENSNEVLGAILLLRHGNRLYNMISCITPAGRQKRVNYYLYDQLIQEFCTEDYCIDFEGSDQPGIAFFYQQFATVNQRYPYIKVNKLHPIIRLFKR